MYLCVKHCVFYTDYFLYILYCFCYSVCPYSPKREQFPSGWIKFSDSDSEAVLSSIHFLFLHLFYRCRRLIVLFMCDISTGRGEPALNTNEGCVCLQLWYSDSLLTVTVTQEPEKTIRAEAISAPLRQRWCGPCCDSAGMLLMFFSDTKKLLSQS